MGGDVEVVLPPRVGSAGSIVADPVPIGIAAPAAVPTTTMTAPVPVVFQTPRAELSDGSLAPYFAYSTALSSLTGGPVDKH